MEELEATQHPTEGVSLLSGAWTRATVIWGLTVVGLSALFWPTLASMVKIWWGSSTFNHCFLILPIVAYLVWERRGVFSTIVPRPCYLGLGVVLLGSLGWLLGAVSDAQVIQQFSFVIILQGSILTVFGMAVARALIFPIFFLLFAVPFGEFLIPKLQDITAHITVALLKATGLPVYSDGVFISVPNGDFHVAQACSGVRFLIASLPLGVLFSNVSFLSWRRRGIVIGLSLTIPIIANGIRAYGIIMIAYLTNNKYALGVDHLIYGWIFFAFVTVVFLAIGMLFVDRPASLPFFDPAEVRQNTGSKPNLLSAIAVALLVIVAANAGPIYNRFVDRGNGHDEVTLKAPAVSGKWRAAQPAIDQREWHPHFKGVTSEIMQDYVRDDGARVTMYLGYYDHQTRDADILGYGNSVAAPAPWEWASGHQTSVLIHGASTPVKAITIVGSYDRRRVWYWYWIDNSLTANPLIAKILIAKSKLLTRRSQAAVIAVSVGDIALNEKKAEVFHDFLAHLQPLPPLIR